LSVDPNLTGWTLGSFRLGKSVRNDLIAKVYEATDIRDGKVVWLKVLSPIYGGKTPVVDCFRKQVELSKQITHPGLLEEHFYSNDQGFYYTVLEHCPWPDLATLSPKGFNAGSAPAYERFVKVFQKICDLMNVMREHNLVHGSITPQKLLCSPKIQIKICDWGTGASLASAKGISLADILEHNSAFIAPELLQGSPLNARCDIYSLGCSLSNWLIGTPHQSVSRQDSIRDKPEIPKWISSLLSIMMAPHPGNRPASWDEILDVIHSRNEIKATAVEEEREIRFRELELPIRHKSSLFADGSVVVCPQCGYGFRGQSGTHYHCLNSDCGYEWDAADVTEIQAYAADQRKATPEIWVLQGSEPAQFVLNEGETVIGRREGCDICLSNLRVSRHHASILREGHICSIRDLGSSTGTRLNGTELVATQELSLGDKIVIAGIVLEYRIHFGSSDEKDTSVSGRDLIAVAKRIQVKASGAKGGLIPISGDRVTLGRKDDCDIVLPFPMVSGRHARIVRDGKNVSVLDLKSANGTFVNGRKVIRKQLEKGDRIQIGPFLFIFEDTGLRRETSLNQLQLDAVDLDFDVPGDKGAKKRILDSVTLSIKPGELVGLIGPSGAGKSTLLNALCGLKPATRGRVLANGEDLYACYDSLRTSIGYVPQNDIVHEDLSVVDTLRYAAQLRLPQDMSGQEQENVVQETLNILGMNKVQKTRVGRLSGGQKKRVSIGVELLARPRLLFLDEPTSGLDPGTEGRMMALFRKLADRGHTIICSTHIMENVHLFDKVAILVHGKLAFFGPPEAAEKYFQVGRMVLLYDRLSEKSPETWQREYQVHASHYKISASDTTDMHRDSPEPLAAPANQFWVLLKRYIAITIADGRNVGLLALQPLLVTLIVCWACSDLSLVLFLAVVSVLWFGSSNAAKEIVKEVAIYQRERMVNLNVAAYVSSKVAVLMLIAVIQSLVVLGIIVAMNSKVPLPWVVGLILFVVAYSGISMGLLVSALSSNVTKAITAIPMVLIPQIILAGAMVPLSDMNTGVRILSYAMTARWGNQASEIVLLQGEHISEGLVRKYPRAMQNLYDSYNLTDRDKPREIIRFLSDHQGKRVQKNQLLIVNLLSILILGTLGLFLTIAVLHMKDPLSTKPKTPSISG
jgi:ABC transport system ATP-binding/permease protein